MDKIDQADLYKNMIYSTLIKIDRAVDSILNQYLLSENPKCQL